MRWLIGVFFAIGIGLIAFGVVALSCIDDVTAVPAAFFGAGFAAVFYAIYLCVRKKRSSGKH